MGTFTLFIPVLWSLVFLATAVWREDNLRIDPAVNLTRHNDSFLGEWEVANLEFTCESVDKTELESLVLITCATIEACQSQLDCLDLKGKKCISSAYSYSSKMITGEKCNNSNPMKLIKPNLKSDSNYSSCLTVSPSDDIEEDFSGAVECISGHFQKKIWFFNYKANKKSFLSYDSPTSEIMNLTIARYSVKDGNLNHEIFQSSGSDKISDEPIYADSAVYINCNLEPFFFGDDAQEDVEIILTRRDGSTVNFTQTDDELSVYFKGTKIRVFADLVSISCAAELLNQTVVKVSVNLTVTVPPLKLTVSSFPISRGVSRLLDIDQKMGCKFTGTPEKIEENREILRNSSTGTRKNVVRNVMNFLRLSKKTAKKFNCEPLEKNSNGPFHFLLDFVPSPPKINRTVESQGNLEDYQEDFEISSGVNGDGESVLRIGVKVKPNLTKGLVNLMKLPVLKCRYYADPKAHVTWVDGNSSVVLATVGTLDGHSTLKNEISLLHLAHDSSENVGANYSCVVENYLGKSVLHFVIEPVAVVDEEHEQEMAEVKRGFSELVHLIAAKFENESKILQGKTRVDLDSSSVNHSYFFVLLFIILILLGFNLAVCLEIFLPRWTKKMERPIFCVRHFLSSSCRRGNSNCKRTDSTGQLNLNLEMQDEHAV